MYRVLIVDDEENVIASLKKSIPWASMNLEVAGEADSMASALELARKRPFHIVVSDIKMPGGSGLELFRELMALAPDTQGILVSGHADFAYAQKAFQCGVIGYCLKPVDAADLCAYLKKAVLRLELNAEPNREALLSAAIAEEDPKALKVALERFGLSGERFYLAVADGGDCPEQLFPGKASVRAQKGRLCFFLEAPLPQEQADALVERRHLNGLGYLTAPSTPDTLAQEYFRDVDRGLPIELPRHYFPGDDPSRAPAVNWRSAAQLFYSNWLNYYVYQTTPYDLREISDEK